MVRVSPDHRGQRIRKKEGSKMKNIVRAIRGRVGPIGLSLIAAVVTAVAFAAVSVAKDDTGSQNGNRNGDAVQPGPGGPPMQQNLSEEDQQKLDEFRQCMSDQGVEPPPRPDENGNGDGTFDQKVQPPSEEERSKMEQAFEACKDKLP